MNDSWPFWEKTNVLKIILLCNDAQCGSMMKCGVFNEEGIVCAAPWWPIEEGKDVGIADNI